MSLNIETTQGLERRVTITVPAEAVEKATREEFKRAAKNVRVDGFRKGHVPAHIIEQRFGASIRQDVLNDLLPRHFFDAVIAEKAYGNGAKYTSIVEANKEVIKDADKIFPGQKIRLPKGL